MPLTDSDFRRAQLRSEAELQSLREESRGNRRQLQQNLGQRLKQLLRGNDADQLAAMQMMQTLGYDLQTDERGQLVARSGGRARMPAVEPQQRRSKPGGWRDETWSRGERETRQAELRDEVILTPESSNVYSFTYQRPSGQKLGTLYVTYKAPILNSSDVNTTRNKSGWTQLNGPAGKTITGKSNAPGPTYAYLNVPPAIFSQMKAAASKGKFVWDKLRVRGTIHGHQYRYILAKPALIDHYGSPQYYVPRKATNRGFVQRSVADPTQREGRRSYVQSTIPPTHRRGSR